MRSRLPWILFFVSLALNVSVLSGILWVGHGKLFGPPSGEQAAEQAAQDFSLTAPQQQALNALRAEVLERRSAIEATTTRWTDTTVAALSEPDYDPETIRWASIERSQPMREFFIWMTGRLHAFVWSLEEGQRRAFVQRIGEDRDFLRNLFFPPKRP